MATDQEEFVFNNDYCARVRELRVALGFTAEQMAIALGVPPARYRKYEVRSPLPLYLVERFCLITNCTIEYLITGKGSKPIRQAPALVVDTKRKRNFSA